MMQNIMPRIGMSIIFDVKRIVAGQAQYESVGFTVFPLFLLLRNEEENVTDFFTNSGIF